MTTIELSKFAIIDIFYKGAYIGKLGNYKKDDEVMKVAIRKIAGCYSITVDTDEMLISLWVDKIEVKDMNGNIIETLKA